MARRCGTHCSMRFSCVFSQIRPKNRIYGLVEVDFLVFGLFFMFRFQTQFDVGMPSRRRFGDRLRLCFHIFFAVAKMFIPFHRTSRVRGPDTLWRVPCTRWLAVFFHNGVIFNNMNLNQLLSVFQNCHHLCGGVDCRFG